jgi:ubiquinone/menaquinone biosynthesis C-methylase UbiE
MSANPSTEGRVSPMSNLSFRLMVLLFNISDALLRYIDRRIPRFGIEPGMTVVDYGCGPGRYTFRFAKLVGQQGQVYAVDIQPLAIAAIRSRVDKEGIGNVQPVLASGYVSGVPDHIADMVFAIDMFFSVQEVEPFLQELKRIAKREGLLVIDDGHQSRGRTKAKLAEGGHWVVVEESRDHLKCRPS